MKKVLKVLFTLFFLITFVNTPFANQCEGIYKDVPANASSCQEIEYLYKQGNLRYAEYFHPDNLISRAQFSKIIMWAFKITENDSGKPFPDFQKGNALYSEVMSLKNAGIVNGTGSGNFEPGSPITRAAAVKMVMEALSFNGYQINIQNDSYNKNFHDIKNNHNLHSYIVQAINFSEFTGFKIIPRFPDGTFRPEQPITRAESSKIIANGMIPLKIQKWKCSTSYCSDIKLDGYPVFTFELELYLNSLINKSRESYNLGPFDYNEALASISDNWNHYMIQSNNISHNTNLTADIIKSNIPFTYNGENVATRTVSDKFNPKAYFEAVEILHQTIMSQQAPNDYHKQNVLSQGKPFNQIGLSVMISKDHIDSSRNRIWIVENFISNK